MKPHQKDVFVVCLNPRCAQPSNRCLDGCNIRTHPTDCSRFYYPADSIIQKDWQEMPDYPADPLGMSVAKKIGINQSQSYFERKTTEFKLKILKIIEDFIDACKEVYPISLIEEKFEQIYGLQKIGHSLRSGDAPEYISKIVNQNMSTPKFNDLIVINEKLDRMNQAFDSICDGVQKNLQEIVNVKWHSQDMKKAMPEHHDKKINFGLMRSKYVTSSKIQVARGVIEFPKLNNIASFLPWLYTDKSFSSGPHTMRITSLRFPLVANSGMLVLEEHDIDTYPYTYFKSLFSKEGKGFSLVEGTQIEHFIGETTSIILRLEKIPSPKAILFDSEMRCKYECHLPDDRSFRLGMYGSGWAVEVMELV